MELKKIYYINGTHWDREWYKTFQGFRYLLMDVMDEVVETLEEMDEFPMYMLDGQTAVLDDYLEISPEMEGRVKRLIGEGRIAVGPWYTMPDEFLPSGESLIRNLLLGHRKAKEYGAEDAMKYGYVCDVFGHIAQLPQILSGFGIRGALMQRGGNRDACPPHFLWVSPDGSECVAYRTPEDFGYGAFYHFVTEAYNQGWDRDLEALFLRAVKEIDREAADLNMPYLVLHDALDHQHITKAAPWLAKRLSEHYGCEVVFRTLDDMVKELWEERGSLPVRMGELAETAHMDAGTNILLTYILSSRYDIKEANDRVQCLWEIWVEPLSAIHAVRGRTVRPGFRDAAYLELMRNHAHDSICGCAVEGVHRDMLYRFRQTEMIGEEVVDDCLRQDAACFGEAKDPQQMVVRIFNPLPYERRETIQTELCFPEAFPAHYSEGEREYEQKNSFFLYDREGNEVPYTLSGIRRERFVRSPTLYKGDCYQVSFSVRLAPMGYTELLVVPAGAPLRSRYIMGQCTGRLTAENPFLRLKVEEDGTLTLTDKRIGRVYSGLLSYRDGADIGDGWMHIRPSSDSIFYSGAPCRRELLYDGPSETAFRITTEFVLPERMVRENGGFWRSGQTENVTITTVVRLGALNDYLEVETRIDNRVMDHRLQLCLPTDVRTGTYRAGQAFATVERPVGADVSTTHWKEPQYGDRNCNGILFKRDETGGLAFLAKGGIHEANAMDDERGTLAVTLYRSFAKTVGHDDYEQMDGQLLGPLVFTYRLLPLTKGTTEGQIVRCRDCLQAGIRQYTVMTEKERPLAAADSFVRLEGKDLAFSILKRPEDLEEDTVVLRLYNCSDREAEGRLIFGHRVKTAEETDLLERRIGFCSPEGRAVPLKLGPRRIGTFRVRLERDAGRMS